MSPSPATGLSKGEREREINSTSFGECKTVPRMYLCLVMSCSGVIAALWRGALHHQGSLAGPYAKVSHEGAKYLLYCVLASSGFRRRGGGGVSCSPFVHESVCVARRRGCGTRLSFHSSSRSPQNSSYHICGALQMVWVNSGWARWQVLPIWATYMFFPESLRHARDQVKVQGSNEWLLEAIFHLFSIKFQHHHEIFPLSKESGSSEALPNNGELK